MGEHKLTTLDRIRVGDSFTFLNPAHDNTYYTLEGFKSNGDAYGTYTTNEGEIQKDIELFPLGDRTECWLVKRRGELTSDVKQSFTLEQMQAAWKKGFDEGYERARSHYKEW